MKPRIVAVRHAPAVDAGLCYGRCDVQVANSAEQAAAAIVAAIGLETGIETVWSSPAARCRTPAAVVVHLSGVPLRVDPRLHEMAFGEWEGRRWDDIEATDGARLAAWTESWRTASPPGGETVTELSERVCGWYEGLTASPERWHLLVGHAGVIRALRVITGRCDWPEAMACPVPPLSAEWLRESDRGCPPGGVGGR